MNCFSCNELLSFLKCVRLTKDDYLCFECISKINAKVGQKYREQGWLITADALIVNPELNEKESA